MTLPRAVIFDLGRVLVDIDMSRGLFRTLTDAVGASPEEVIQRLGGNPLFVEYNTGRLTPDAFHRAACDTFGLRLSFDEFAVCWCDIFSMRPEMEVLLREVCAACPVAILSDTDPLHWYYVCEKFPVLQEVPVPVLSYEIGVMKPDAAAYSIAAERLGFEPASCFFTDDLERNIDGARRVGMHAAQFESVATTRCLLEKYGILASKGKPL